MNNIHNAHLLPKCTPVLLSALFSVTLLLSEAETFDSLDQFENVKGWGVTDSVSLNSADTKKLILSPSSGAILQNGAEKNPAQYLKTKKEWGDHEINVEFMIPGGSNSGFYVLGRYEVQVFDSHWKKENVTYTDMGGVYERWDDKRTKSGLKAGFEGVKPMKNMAKPAGEWNTMTIKFKAPRFNEIKEKESHAQFVEVILNGEVVQSAVEAKGPTRSHPEKFEEQEGSLYIQGDHGPVAIKNLKIEARDYSDVPSKEPTAEERAPLSATGEPLIELVAMGKEAYSGKGCVECHIVTDDKNAVKTGPSLYGVFKEVPVDHVVVDGHEKTDLTLKADKAFLVSSVRASTKHLAKQTDGTAYLPIMPSYPEKVVTDTELRAIYAYLKTLNPAGEAGPNVVYEEAGVALPYDPDLDPMAINTYDGTKVYRGIVKNGTSARAIHVGLSNGQNYAFDPMSLSIKSVWTGRFLDTREDINGRGGKMNEIGAGAALWPYPNENFMRPLVQGGELYLSTLLNSIAAEVNFVEEAFSSLTKDLKGNLKSYTYQETPTISYELEGNLINLQFLVKEDGSLEAVVTGSLKSPLTLTYPHYAMKSAEVTGGVLDLTKGHWTLPTGELNATWSGVPHHVSVSTSQKRPPVVIASPLIWSDSVKPADPAKGYSLKDGSSPVYSTGVSPLFEPTAIDFDAKGTPYIGSRTAGIWTIKNGVWHPFALGAFDVLGLEVVKEGEIIISQKPEITRITDTDGDGKADLFETLSDDYFFGGGYHAYTHGPAVAKDGSIHFNLNLQHVYNQKTFNAGGDFMGSMGGYRGWSCKIAPDGTFIPFASGLRSPAGIAFSPNETLYYTENQGEFMGTSKIFHLKQDGFYGHPSSLVDKEGYTPEKILTEIPDFLTQKEVPAVLLPHNVVANSPGNPVWDTTEGAFGPFSGQMFVGDQTLSNIHRVHIETVNGVEQGSVMPFMDKLPSGVMRLSFSPEGELWVGQTGRGWASRGGELSALQKISYSGEVERSMHRIEARKTGFELFFTKPIEVYERGSLKYMALDSWYYLDSKAYGSKEQGKRPEKVTNLSWSEDGMSCLVEVENLNALLRDESDPGNTARVIRFNLQSTEFGKGKTPFHCMAYYTLNVIPN